MKILLVDDSKSARYALRLQLQRHDVEVETADSAEAAFEMLKSELPDAILMDHMMPGLNGFEALEILKEDPRTAHIPVVMCTSHEEADFVATARKKGVLGILPKSVAPERLPEILDILRAALQGSTQEAPTVQPAAAPVETPTTAGLSEEVLEQRIGTHIQAQLARMLTPMIDDLRRDLAEQLLAEARQLVDTRCAELLAAQGARPEAPSLDEIQRNTEQLLTKRAPDLIRVEIEAEHNRLVELIESHQSAPGDLSASIDAAVTQRLSTVEEHATNQAVIAARREAHETTDSALESTRQAITEISQSLGSGMKRMQAMIVLAALAGMGAAAAVFYLLQP